MKKLVKEIKSSGKQKANKPQSQYSPEQLVEETAQTTASPVSLPKISSQGKINSQTLTPSNVIALQTTIGNRAVGRILRERSSQPSAPSSLSLPGAANVIQRIGWKVVCATLGIDQPRLNVLKGLGFTLDQLNSFGTAGYNHNEIEAIGKSTIISKQLFSSLYPTKFRCADAESIINATGKKTQDVDWIFKNLNKLKQKTAPSIVKVIQLYPAADDYKKILLKLPDNMTIDLAKEITTLIPVSADWHWLFDKLTGLQMTYPFLKQVLQAVQAANHWKALVSANINDVQLGTFTANAASFNDVGEFLHKGFSLAHLLTLVAPGGQHYTLTELKSLIAGLPPADPIITWLEQHSVAVKTVLGAGKSVAAIRQMATYNFTDPMIRDTTRWKKTDTGIANNTYFPFRDDHDQLKEARYGHFSIRHTYEHCTLAIIENLNSFWPVGTKVTHIDSMVRDTMRRKNQWVHVADNQYQLANVPNGADGNTYTVVLRYNEPRMSQFYPAAQPGITTYSDAQMQQFINVNAL